MSYHSNPITTRLKITRGWFQEYFPQDKLSYSNETLFFYKYYLLTTFFLKKNKINLIRFNISTDNQNITLAYFNVQKQLIKKRNRPEQLYYQIRRKKYFRRQERVFFKLAGYYCYFGRFKHVKPQYLRTRKTKKAIFQYILRASTLRALTVFRLQSWNKNTILNTVEKMS